MQSSFSHLVGNHIVGPCKDWVSCTKDVILSAEQGRWDTWDGRQFPQIWKKSGMKTKLELWISPFQSKVGQVVIYTISLSMLDIFLPPCCLVVVVAIMLRGLLPYMSPKVVAKAFWITSVVLSQIMLPFFRRVLDHCHHEIHHAQISLKLLEQQ